MSTREDRTRQLLDAAALTRDVDVDRLWTGVRDTVSVQPRRRPARAGLTVAAAAAVTVGVVGATVWAGGQRGAAPAAPVGGADRTITLNPTPTRPSRSPSAPTSSPTVGAPENPLPVIPGRLSLPKNQRSANYSPTTSGWHIEGKVRGIAQVRIRGELHNLVLAPGVMVNERNRPAICEVALPVKQQINLTGEELGRHESCSTLPWPGGKGVRGLITFRQGDSNVVQEWAGWVTMTVAAAPSVARIDYRVGGQTVTLQHRFSDPAWAGAYFIGFYPDAGSDRASSREGDGLVTYYGRDGKVLAEETLR